MTVNVDIYGRSIEVTDRINDYVTKKISRLDRFLPDIDEARVDLAYVKSARSAADRQVAQITVRGKGYILRSEERADDIFTAVDAALKRNANRALQGKHIAVGVMANQLRSGPSARD
jgi:putative sigma-54 modulation protein